MDGLLVELNRRGVRLQLDGDQLRMQAPKGALSAELRQSIAENKEGLLMMLRSMEHRAVLPKIVARPEARYEPFPLVDMQHGYWIGRLSLVESGGVATHVYTEYEPTGLDVDRLSASLQKVIERHDMLRAIIQPDGHQRILKEVLPYRIATTDVRGETKEDQEAAISKVRERMSHQVLPSDRWPIFEFHAVLLDDDLVRLCMSLDMLILDGSSIFLLLEEWARYYTDPDYAPPPLELTYRDYVLAEKTLQEGELFKPAEKYWMARVKTLLAAPDLPVRKPGSQTQSSQFDNRSGFLPKPQWAQLKAKAMKRGATPSVLLMACYAEVLRRWAKEAQFTLNLTLFNRLPVHPQINQILGDFTTTDLLEMHAAASDSFADRVRRAQLQLSQDLEHSHFSGVRFMRERMRSLGQCPGADMPIVFTSVLGLTGEEEGYDAKYRSVFGEEVYGISQTPQVWLDCQVMEQDGGLIYSWDMVEAMFPGGMVDDMFQSLSALIEKLTDDDALWDRTGCIAELPPSQQQILAAANATQADIPAMTLHELVAVQARKRPEALAVIAGDGNYTFGELTAHANRLGRYLRKLGASVNQLVAVAIDKGREQAVAVLGILHSGAAYLPIDPHLPEERRWRLLTRGEAKIVVTQSHLRHLAWPEGTTVITLDDEEVATSDAAPMDFVQGPQDLAYVIFTSGSTGEPKGVAIDHRGATNTVQDINLRYRVTEKDRVLALSALNFDLSVYDIFGVLGAGGTVVMPIARNAHDPVHWSRLIDQHGVTLWNSVPQLLQMWVEHVQARRIKAGRSLRHVQLSGDWIPVKLPDQVCAICPGVNVVSLGGATEASIWSIEYPIGEVDPAWKSIPYGKALANQHMYVLNSLLEERATGAIGEIYIGGIGVALGYWRDEVRTAERFVAHPVTGERLYRTGDLGRYLPDGNIEFLGREDSQVKINGHRIELGEIEATLRRQSGVQEAVVNVTAVEGGQKQLVAYVVPRPGDGNALFHEEGLELLRTLEERRYLLAEVLDLSVKDYELLHAQPLQAHDRAWGQLERIALDVIARSLGQLGLFRRAGETHSVADIFSQYGLDAKRAPLIRFWLNLLTQEGSLQIAVDGSYRCEAPFVAAELDQKIAHAIETLPSEERSDSSFFLQCVNAQIALLKGERSALDLMFSDDGEDAGQTQYEYNPIAVVHNKVCADALQTILDRLPPTAPIRVLEIGAGGGGLAASLLPLLPPERARYVFSDVSSFFLEPAKARFGDFTFVEYETLNANQTPQAQGFAFHCFDLIVAGNALSLVNDTQKTLEHLRSLLAPSGVLLLIEETQNSPVQGVTVGFLDGFGSYGDARRENGLPLMSVAQWKAQIEQAGFRHFCASPTFSLLTHGTRQHVMIAEAPERVRRFRSDALREALARSLPDFMVPRHYMLLDRFPLSANGKVDLKALPVPSTATEKAAPVGTAPRNDTERRLIELWKGALSRDAFGVDTNFFDLGGDSLIAMTMINRLRIEFDLTTVEQAEILQQLFARPTIEALAEFVGRQVVPSEVQVANG